MEQSRTARERETWKESDNIYSNSHPMFGSVTEWFYRWLGGIRPDPQHPGFKRFYIKPFLPRELDSVYTTYNAPTGKIVSQWVKEKEGHRYQFTVPEGSIAQVVLTKRTREKICVLKGHDHLANTNITDLEDGKFNLKGGEYTFRIKQ